jgi:hypothetical protein
MISFWRRVAPGVKQFQPKPRRLVRRRFIPRVEQLEDRRILASDFGDAPDLGAGTGPGDYSTLSTDNGPSHTIVPGLYLGAGVDGEDEAAAAALANADDLDDGLTDPGSDLLLTPGESLHVRVKATNTTGAEAMLFGWIDFNGDGVFDNANERAEAVIFSGSSGVVFTLEFGAVPEAFEGRTYARFRLSTDAAAADPTGLALDGEVEDYGLVIREARDFGDLPEFGLGYTESYFLTRAVDNGPSHGIVPGLFIGGGVDAEEDGILSPADGDDLTGEDDEDLFGPSFFELMGPRFSIDVVVTNTTGASAMLYGWINFWPFPNRPDTFTEHERAAVEVPDGTIGETVTLMFPEISDPPLALLAARFRLSTDPAAAEPFGAAADGEVEDYIVRIGPSRDFGDAPDAGAGTAAGNYNTLSTDNGPSHIVADSIFQTPSLFLGGNADREFEAKPTVTANGDDLALDNVQHLNDEDGLVDPDVDLLLTPGQQPHVRVVVENNHPNTINSPAMLFGWIDYDGDGVFDNGTERASVAVPFNPQGETVTLVFPVVPANFIGSTYARFRLSSDPAAANPTGLALDGEVEDYQAFSQPSWQNPQNPLSVLGGPTVTIFDLLALVTDLRENFAQTGEIVHDLRNPNHVQAPPFQAPYLDPSGDQKVTLEDVLLVLHELRRQIEGSLAPATDQSPSL